MFTPAFARSRTPNAFNNLHSLLGILTANIAYGLQIISYGLRHIRLAIYVLSCAELSG